MLCAEKNHAETLEHFFLNCKILEDIRLKLTYINKIHRLIGNLTHGPNTRPTWLLPIRLYCQNSPSCNQDLQEEIERLTRRLCWDLHIVKTEDPRCPAYDGLYFYMGVGTADFSTAPSNT